MSQESTSRSLLSHLTTFVLIWGVLPLAMLLLVVIFLISGGQRYSGENRKTSETGERSENHLAEIRSILSSSGKQADLPTCRSLIPLLNAHLAQREKLSGSAPVPVLQANEQNNLKTLLKLGNEEIRELSSANYTPLDAHHLETCFLLRDAARSLEISIQAGDKETLQLPPLEKAITGFNWTMRQVRLSVPGELAIEETVPVSAVLRRGHGSALERGLVFLALLEQFGQEDASYLQGCLLFCPDERGNRRLWACGVAIGEGTTGLYLFDPRLGLPIPGPDGKGIAKLEQAIKDPSILGQLFLDSHRYDVTPEQASKSEAQLVIPLSALAPRMQLLQDQLLRDRSFNEQPLPPAVRVRLAESLTAAQASMKKALESFALSIQVGFWTEGTLLLRRFLPKEEGGNDEGISFPIRLLRGYVDERDQERFLATVRFPRQRLYQLQMVPWSELPAVFRDPTRFRPDFGPGLMIREFFAAPFLRSLNDPSSPHEQMLRGRMTRVIPELVRDKELTLALRDRLKSAEDLGPGLKEWLDRANTAYAELERARGTPDESKARARTSKLVQPGDPIEVVISGVVAGPLGAQYMYQLAQCLHEQASRAQSRIQLGERAGLKLADDRSGAQKTWADAESQWKEFLEANPGRPGVASARVLLAEAQARLGNTKEAIANLRDLSAPMTTLEKLASLLRARRLEVGK